MAVKVYLLGSFPCDLNTTGYIAWLVGVSIAWWLVAVVAVVAV